MGRARDDLDMERALRPRINAPDVVRSTLSQKELKYNESTIDQLLGTPNKIFIPERYVPEHTPELTAEEKKQRLKKADAIRKMLSETRVTAPDGDGLLIFIVYGKLFDFFYIHAQFGVSYMTKKFLIIIYCFTISTVNIVFHCR